MFVSNSDTFASGSWEASATSKAWTLAQTNATATVYVKFKDAAGNESTSVSDTIIHDSIQPSATITSSTVSNGGATATSPAAFTVTFSESVTGFSSGDVTVGNGSVSSFAGSGTTYTFNITGPKGAVTVDISANTGFDAVGNGNTAATQFAFTFDQPPTISDITNKTTLINTALSGIAVTITDDDDVLTCTTSLSVSSSNPTLIDTGNFGFSGTAPDCSIALTPKDYQAGTSIITVTVTDGVAASNQSDQFSLTVPTIVVESVYSTNGNWNDYVRSDGSSCTGDGVVADENKWNKCIHGGERKKVAVPWESSCSDLALSDALGAFTWTCSNSGGYAIFYSSELNEGKKLSTLIDFTTTPKFAVNSATLQKNSLTVTSDNTDTVPWWTNTITELPDNSSSGVQVLSPEGTTGTIYVLSDSRASNGYNINADKVALVIKDGQTLTYGGSATYNCVRATGESPDPSNYTCLVSAGSQKFLWIEGDFNGTPASGTTVNHVLHFYGSVFSKFRYVEVYGANYMGLSFLHDTAKTYHNNTAQYINAHNIKGVPTQTTDNSYGIYFDTGYSLLTDFSTANNEVGIWVVYCDWCVIQDGKINNNSIYGHYNYGTDYAVYSRVQITNNQVGMRVSAGYWRNMEKTNGTTFRF
ncbi:MAG: hypothetical protein HYW48_00115 [Deltaproteobacteria bacterium]|nr:hypothetical protein [Deltaproteobacteria bacterium]